MVTSNDVRISMGSRAFKLHESEIRDLIDIFYRWTPGKFLIDVKDTDRGKLRGSHRNTLGSHVITLFPRVIADHVMKGLNVGGNSKASSSRLGEAMVLVHEIQHANQTGTHGSRKQIFFNARGYLGRPCERDARGFVDENRSMILNYFQEPVEAPSVGLDTDDEDLQGDPLQMVADDLGELQMVVMGDIIRKLRSVGINNAANVQTVRKILIGMGKTVTLAEGSR